MNGGRRYGVGTISWLLEIIGLFYIRALLKRSYLAKETFDFKKPTNLSHPITQNYRQALARAAFRRAIRRGYTNGGR